MAEFHYLPSLPLDQDPYEYRLLSDNYVSLSEFEGKAVLKVDPQALTLLADAAIKEVSHLYRASHLQQLRDILDDPEATENDRFVAREMLKNANIAAGMVLPGCQDTGTAIVMAKKGQQVWTGGGDQEALSRGIFRAFAEDNLRFSQLAPLTMYEEKNTGTNLPAQIDIEAVDGDEYKFLFITKGGGSANKTFLFQETKALLNPQSMMRFMREKLPLIGTSACPPYHLAVVIGGTSAEANLKMVKLASARYLDTLPEQGNEYGQAFRDRELEQEILELTRELGIGAQFGGKYFAHDVRVIRLPRHGASCPVGIGVSCSADRNILGRIDKDGIWLEQLEHNPAKYLPEPKEEALSEHVVKIDLNQPMDAIRAELSKHPIKTRVSLSGPIIVARDIAHAKLKERLDRDEPLPDYFKDHIVYYAGPAKTPEGYASGSFGPTTAGRMDSYVELFQKQGGSMVMLAKGNRSRQVTESCRHHGGFYLGSVGGAAAILAKQSIKKVEVIDYPELGMEAVYRIEVEDFPAFIIIDDKGHDFFSELGM
ncbi:MAG: fumarate hydratase [Gammaproteobacteria bacterium]|nr:fumarate hydratase [Gammaproteobacteria bacterium]MCW8839574.1 fumarate hydratase [Gammaproteobacteria bacterium]MCW8973417.1 fumarate hydratase [Gammaproteobacteria bacterium]MCW8992257.1 fumarate hydratase [Gammaproteobacteria bacterium]